MPGASMIRGTRQHVQAKPESLCAQQHTQMHWARFEDREVVSASPEDAMGSKNTPFGG